MTAPEREKLLALAARCEAASGPDRDELRAIFRLAYRACFGEKPERILGGSDELTAWLHAYNPFEKKIGAEAWLDAAMTLLPAGSGFDLRLMIDGSSKCDLFLTSFLSRPVQTYAGTPALALTAASLRARALAQEPR